MNSRFFELGIGETSTFQAVVDGYSIESNQEVYTSLESDMAKNVFHAISQRIVPSLSLAYRYNALPQPAPMAKHLMAKGWSKVKDVEIEVPQNLSVKLPVYVIQYNKLVRMMRNLPGVMDTLYRTMGTLINDPSLTKAQSALLELNFDKELPTRKDYDELRAMVGKVDRTTAPLGEVYDRIGDVVATHTLIGEVAVQTAATPFADIAKKAERFEVLIQQLRKNIVASEVTPSGAFAARLVALSATVADAVSFVGTMTHTTTELVECQRNNYQTLMSA